MKFFFIFILTFFLSNFSFASTWIRLEPIPFSQVSSDNDSFVDIDSINREGNIVSVWKRSSWAKDYQSTEIVYIDCKTQLNRFDRFTAKDGNFYASRGEFWSIPSEKYTIGRQLFNMLCK